jgi:HAE1 family hydrophobic/amphiphilic exporter-1
MWITRVSIGNPVFATMMMAALLVLGAFSYNRLSVELFPDVSFPVVVVQTVYPGASPENVEEEVTRPIEEAVNTVSGIKELRSRSYQGTSVVIAEFQLSIDPRVAAQDVRERVAAVQPTFRDEIEPPRVTRFNPEDQPVISLGATSSSRSLRDLTTLADQLIRPRLENVTGVGQVTLVGGVEREMRVVLDPERMVAQRVGITQVIEALRRDNQEVPAGSVVSGGRERVVQVRGRLEDARDFAGLIVTRRGGSAVTLGEIARIEDSQQEEESSALINGQRALSVDVVKAQGENTIGVVDGVRAAMAELAPQLPEDVRLQVVRDDSAGIRNALADVRATLIEGAALTVAIVFLFLASWRSTIITGLTLPIALLGTFLAVYAMGFTLNSLTLMALSLSVGLLIDDAIVVRENIVRHAAMGKPPHQAALEGTAEIGLAVLATTLCIVAVFLPVGFMGGIIGRFFYQFGLTVAVAVLISMFVSFTLDPMLSSVWHDPGRKNRFFTWLERQEKKAEDSYVKGLAWALGRRKTVVAIAFAAFAGAFPLLGVVGTEFVPEADLSQLQVQFNTPVGSSLQLTESKARQVDAVLRQFPEVEFTYASVNSGFTRGKHNASVFVQLVERDQRSRGQREIAQAMRKRLAAVAGIEVNQVGAPNRFGGGKPIQVSVLGQERRVLDRLAAQVAAAMRGTPGLADIEASNEEAQPQVAIDVNRELASDLGASFGEVAEALRALVAGQAVGNWRAPDGRYYDVTVRLASADRAQPEDLGRIPLVIDGDDGPRVVNVREIAQIRESLGEQQINRRSQMREVLVSANVAGPAAGDAAEALRQRLAGIAVPDGYRLLMGGESQDLAESAAYAGQALLLAIVFIYLILASQFGSFIQPVAIMMSLPMALIGVALALLAAGSTLNMFSAIGFIMLMGLVTKNGILLVDFINRARAGGLARAEAALAAGRVRLRPIAMTTLAIVFGMLPLSLGLGEGGEQRAPMGQAVIGGVLTSGLLTLIVVPVIYTYLDDLAAWAKRKSGTDHVFPARG